MLEYRAEDWRGRLSAQGLDRFEDFWQLPEDWVEPPNRRRGGWSGVSRHVIGTGTALYVKRQENHVYRCWPHPLRGQATIARELSNLLHCHRQGVETLVPVYAAVRREAGQLRAILVTEELTGFRDLDAVWPQASRRERRDLLVAVAQATRALHAAHLQHNSLYPKHVFVRIDAAGAEVRFIDLEKAKWRLFKRHALRRDLDTLNRHWRGPSRSDRLRFLLAYRGEQRLDTSGRRLWRLLAGR